PNPFTYSRNAIDNIVDLFHQRLAFFVDCVSAIWKNAKECEHCDGCNPDQNRRSPTFIHREESGPNFRYPRSYRVALRAGNPELDRINSESIRERQDQRIRISEIQFNPVNPV